MYYVVLFLMSQYHRFENYYNIYINFQSLNYFLTVFKVVSICILMDFGLGISYIYFGIIKKSDQEIALIEQQEKEENETKLPRTEMIIRYKDDKFTPCN